MNEKEAEERARQSIKICLENENELIDLWGNTRLTDDKCKSMATESPFSYQSIRSVFGFRLYEN